MKKIFPIAAMLIALCACKTKQQANNVPAYLDPNKPVEERIEDALSRMTLEEKVRMVHAQSKFCSRGVQSLGIPDIWCTDGPHGIRPEVLWDEWDQAGWTNDSTTAFPALSALAATWNRDLGYLYGQNLAEEALFRNKTVILGPGVNIYRTPLNGRNFEYFGEDPYLTSEMVVPYIEGVQSKGVAACIKHFALNNNEINRHTSNVNVDDRTLYEIYLPAFKAAVQKAGVWAVMSAYNLYQDEHACNNKRLIMDILKGEWEFDGVAISDWGGVHNTLPTIENGLDMEFGSWTDGLYAGVSNAYDNYYMANPYLEALANGQTSEATLDDKVRRILRLEYRTNMREGREHGSQCSPAHYAAARKIGAESIVLLKNDDNVLPIPQDAKILVVGENAIKMMTVGGGSSSLKVKDEILPLDGIKARFANVNYQRGYIGDVTGEYNGVTSGQDLTDSRSEAQLIADAVKAAENADYVVFIGGLNKGYHQDCEDGDRLSYDLPYAQDKVIEALAATGKKLVVVNISGNAVAMPWIDKVPAVLQDWYLGTQAGNSLADVLSGDVNPSAKLPFTIPVKMEDGPLKTVQQYPGVLREGIKIDNMEVWDVDYSEGIYVGYRWYEKQNVKPQFAFGHGLSYTTFEYGDAKLKKSKGGDVVVSIDVKNIGNVAGAEVVQLYVHDVEASVDRPQKELKNFDKVYLPPGESATLKFTLSKDAFSYFDADKHEWVAEPGDYEISFGSASDDIRSKVIYTL